jgi:hypothetical protein
MTFWILAFVALVVVAAVVVTFVKNESLTRERIEAELHDPRTPTLEYVVPTGEDPAVVIAALERAGYTAGVDSRGTHQIVLVKCPDGTEPSRTVVRSVIATAGTTTPRREVPAPRDVRFRDETGA